MVNRKELLTRAIENGFPRREEGYPLLLPEASGAPAEEYTVYGNTADGAAVGEKTKNVISYPFSQLKNTATLNGITFTDNGDGTITANGTATGEVWYKYTDNVKLSTGSYVLSGSPSGGGVATYLVQVGVYNTKTNEITQAFRNPPVGKPGSGTLTFDHDSALLGYIYIKTGVTVDHLVFKPQLEEGTAATPFEPYGYKIPLVNGEEETVLYLPAPLGEGESVNSTEASLPPLPLHEGTNQITAATAAPPAKIRVDYQARVKK